ncbi:MAG: nucleotide exchange factor GrpE [Acidimicrobiia bacterium]
MSSENNIPNDDSFDEGFDDLDRIPSWVDDDEMQNEVIGSETESEDVYSLPGNSDVLLDSLKETEEQRDMYIEALRQLQADFENYKKRVQRDIDEEAENRSMKLMEDLLPVMDNFELALNNIDQDSEMENIRKGIELVYNDLCAVLERQGLEVIHSQGQVFDPEIHEAVSHEDNGEHEEEVVVEVLRSGYKVRGRVVRPAMVKVAK